MRAFGSLDQFVAHLASVAREIPKRQSLALRDGGEVIQKEARAEIGTLQSRAGPFGAWPELSPRTQQERVKAGYSPNDPLRRSGALRDHIELNHDGKQAVVGVPSEMVGSGTDADPIRNIGDVAIAMELGTDRVPARSFLGRSAFVKGHEAVGAMASVLTDAISGRPYRKPRADGKDDIPF